VRRTWSDVPADATALAVELRDSLAQALDALGEQGASALTVVGGSSNAESTVRRVASNVVSEPRFGRPWREPIAAETPERVRQANIDVELVERGLRGHVDTECALAETLRRAGIMPVAPAPDGPNFDVAWEHGGVLYVAEVKSITDKNEERQLRLGLGQVVRYRSLLAAQAAQPVRGVLVPERAPRDERWRTTCLEVGVVLVAGEELAGDLPRLLAGPAP
jgi:hypothetical protein